MATQRVAIRAIEENEPVLREGKPQANMQAGQGEPRRRALGDIGNVQGVITRAQAAKKEAASKNPSSLRARDPNATAAQLRARAPTGNRTKAVGVSLSSLLQNRSEAATVAKPTFAPPPSPLPDIDSVDKDDPLSAYEYAGSIYNYYRRVEPRFQVPVDYMSTQQVEITEKMRGILIDWLIEVHLKFKLMPETLYLTVNLIDRFLAVRNVTRKRLQLVGVAAMLIASKYEEIWAPEVRDFVYISDHAYTREEILAMEKTMLQVLTYDLTVPTVYNFLARFKKAAGVAGTDHTKVHHLALYLAELSLVDIKMLAYPVSQISAACLHLALLASGHADSYPYALRKHARYSVTDILPCARHLVALWQRSGTSNLKAVHKKFCSSKFSHVAQHGVVAIPSLPEAAAV